MTDFITSLLLSANVFVFHPGQCYTLATQPIKIKQVLTNGVVANNWDGTELYLSAITLNTYTLKQVSCKAFDKQQADSQGSSNRE